MGQIKKRTVMKTQETLKKDRKYFIDWLRIALIISVFFFHVRMIFRPEQWHVNKSTLSTNQRQIRTIRVFLPGLNVQSQ